MSLSDLELCKKIAEIVYSDTEKCGFDYSDCGTFMVDCNGDEFNPLTNKALLFDLMVKHQVQTEWFNDELGQVGILRNNDDELDVIVAFNKSRSINRAILECIVEFQSNPNK